MSDPADEDDQETEETIEQRVSDLEKQVADVEPEDLETRIAGIEQKQQRLGEAIEQLASRWEQETEEVPTTQAVEQLYQDLQAVEEQTTDLKRDLETLISEDEE
jgi:Ribonuclease G/E